MNDAPSHTTHAWRCSPQVSILCAARDEGQFIGEMIESVQKQGFSDWELLIVDDRSTDATSRIVREYGRLDARVKLLNNVGVAGKNQAWNRAYENASGGIILFFCGDDLMPANSLEQRLQFMDGLSQGDWEGVKGAVFGKLRMFSDDAKYHGTVSPRGKRGSRAGGAVTMTRAMAREVFPLDERLPNEDIWVSSVVSLRAAVIGEHPIVVVDYRIHDRNSFQRTKEFDRTSAALAARARAYDYLVANTKYQWSRAEKNWFESMSALEELRAGGRIVPILASRKWPVVTRLRAASHANPMLYRIRHHFYRFFSGW